MESSKKQVTIRCCPAWRSWLRDVTSACDMQTSLFIENSVLALAKKHDAKPPTRLVRTRAESVGCRINDELRLDRKDSAINVSCEPEWRDWVREFSDSLGMTLFGMLDLAVTEFAMYQGFPEPPSRTTKYRTTLTV